MRNRINSLSVVMFCALAVAAGCLPVTFARAANMKIYLMAGQSNMEGQAYTWDNFATVNNWNVPSLDYMIQSQAYYDSLPGAVYGFKQGFGADWMTGIRDDVWSVNYLSRNSRALQVRTEQDLWQGDDNLPNYPVGIQPLSVGFGKNGAIGVRSEGTNMTPSYFGAELAMGHLLGDTLNEPVFLFKSATGGTTLAEDWRPPSAVAARGGSVGSHYTNTMNLLDSFLDDLDADLGDDGVLNTYGNATGYEVAGFVWLQGWNEMFNNGEAEYADNIVDLVNDIRAADSRIPDDLPALIVESADQHAGLNAQRIAAVATLNSADPGSAVYQDTDGLRDVNYGGLNAQGQLFNNSFGSHFHVRPENYLEIGWRIGEAILANGYTGSSVPCDFDSDSDCDIDDVDALITLGDLTAPGLAVPPADAKFDLDGDDDVDNDDYSKWLTDAATQNGHASPYRAADTDLDRDVDITDFNNLATNFDSGGLNAATNGQSKGNNDGDNDVDITDFNNLASSFNPGGYDDAAAEFVAEGDPGTVELAVDAGDGRVYLLGNTVAISGFQIFSPGNSLVASDSTPGALQFVIATNTSTYAEGAFIDMPVDGFVLLGSIYDTQVQAFDLSFEYTMIGQPTVQGNVYYIPEPASLVLFSMGGLLLLRRHRAV